MNDANLPSKTAQPPTQHKTASAPAPLARPTAVIGWTLIVGGLAGFAFWGAGWWALLAGAVGVVALFIKRRSKTELAHASDGSEADLRLKELKRYVSKTQYLENVGDLGERAAQQLSQISHRFTQFQELLVLKFDPEEITFARYHAAAQHVYLSVLDHLQLIATTLNSVDAIDPRYIKARVNELAGDSNSAAEIKNLEEREQLRDRQIATVRELLSLNEQAITEFDRVRAALADAQTRKGASDVGLEAAMAELALLAERAKKYEINR